jgi:hypothetical protein
VDGSCSGKPWPTEKTFGDAIIRSKAAVATPEKVMGTLHDCTARRYTQMPNGPRIAISLPGSWNAIATEIPSRRMDLQSFKTVRVEVVSAEIANWQKTISGLKVIASDRARRNPNSPNKRAT